MRKGAEEARCTWCGKFPTPGTRKELRCAWCKGISEAWSADWGHYEVYVVWDRGWDLNGGSGVRGAGSGYIVGRVRCMRCHDEVYVVCSFIYGRPI